MSSLGRGADIDDLGRYYTPGALARACVTSLPLERWTNVLEPSVGAGAWTDALQLVAGERELNLNIEMMDVDPEAPGFLGLYSDGARYRRVGDFLHMDPMQATELVIGNPPYSVSPAEAAMSVPWVKVSRGRKKPIPVVEIHVRRALSLVYPKRGSVAFLLPHGFLAAKERDWFWQRFPARRIQTVVPRPSFTTGGGNDNVNYAFIWWDFSYSGPTSWERLRWEPESKKR